MQVLFLQDVRNVARKGEIKQVKDGYYKNFLSPRKLAVLATATMAHQAEKMRERATVRKDRLVEQAAEVKKKLHGMKLKLTKKATGEKLYGSVTEKDIIEAVMEEANVELDKSNVKMEEHLKTVGDHEVTIHLTDGVEATIKVSISGGK